MESVPYEKWPSVKIRPETHSRLRSFIAPDRKRKLQYVSDTAITFYLDFMEGRTLDSGAIQMHNVSANFPCHWTESIEFLELSRLDTEIAGQVATFFKERLDEARKRAAKMGRRQNQGDESA